MVEQHARQALAVAHPFAARIDARLHTGDLRIAAALSDAGALQDELKDFQRKVSDAGRATYAARTGAHDDLVLAVAIALWWAMSGPVTSVEALRV